MTNSVDYIQSQRWLAYPMMNFFIIIIFFVNYFFALNFIHKKKKQEKWKVFFYNFLIKNIFCAAFSFNFISLLAHKALSEIGIYVKFSFSLLSSASIAVLLLFSVCFLFGLCFDGLWGGLFWGNGFLLGWFGWIGLLSTRLLIKMYNLEVSWVLCNLNMSFSQIFCSNLFLLGGSDG